MTTLHAGGKFGGGGYKVSGGLHGVGVSVVNALTEWLEVEVHLDGKIHRQDVRAGVPDGACRGGRHQPSRPEPRVTFWPDPEIFPDTEFD